MRGLFTWRRQLAIVSVVAAIGVAGCGGDDDSDSDGERAVPATSGVTATKVQSVPADDGSTAGNPDCESKIDPATGEYQKTPEECHLQFGE